ncbi:MAG: prephenate dehydrogenase [Calditrichaceae bacterium]|nr:prephenate dehydrogenase [Calditrichaceae bacterium]
MKIVISGLGLIGASLALAIRKNMQGVVLYGYDFPDVLQTAVEKKIIDHPINDWSAECADADIIFLCAPLSVIEKHLHDLNRMVNPDCIVTDVGSTKAELSKIVESLNFTGVYIGGHPMTGAEKSGINAANPLLFENALYILTNINHHNSHIVEEKLYPVLNAIKARTLIIDPEVHDKIMALISHLPQVIAIGLMNLTAQKNSDNKPYFELAAGGFRDLTRIASSPYTMWKDILQSNKSNIEGVIDEFIKLLKDYRDNLGELSQPFINANQCRRNVPRHTKGFLQPLTDVMVYVNDQMGVIAKISNALSENNIDIRDIELLKIREKEGGVFRLSFSGREQAEQAIRILESINYQAFIRE